MKYCPNCHAGQWDSVSFCSNCGAAMTVADSFLTETIQMDDIPINKSAASAPQKDTAKKNKNDHDIKKEKISKDVEANIVKAIITICCCFPFGIVALVYTMKVQSKLRENDYDAASEACKKANIWGNLAIALGILWILYYVFFTFSALDGGLMDSLYGH